MSQLFKNKYKLILLLLGLMIAVTLGSVKLAQVYQDSATISDADLDEALTQAEQTVEEEKEPEPVSVSFNIPSTMRGAVVSPGVDFILTPEDSKEAIIEQIDSALASARDFSINSIIISTGYEDKVIYSTSDAEKFSSEYDLMEELVSKCRAEDFYVYGIFDISKSNENNVDSILIDAGDFAEKYELDGILIDGYQNEPSENSYSAYSKNGGGIGYENYMKQVSEANVKSAANGIRGKSPNTQVGILAYPVWANYSEEQQLGSETTADYTAYDDSNADTRLFIEHELLDFVVVDAYGATTDTKMPFDKVASWWADLAVNREIPLYIEQAVSKVGTSDPGWWDGNELVNQAKELDSLPGVSGNVFDSITKLKADTAGATTKLMSYYEENKDSVPEKEEDKNKPLDDKPGDTITNPESSEAITSSESSAVSEPSSTESVSKEPESKPVETLPTITLNRSTLTLREGKTATLRATVSNGSSDDIAWSSSNESVARVGNSGVVTGSGRGDATITATIKGVSATCSVSVVSDSESSVSNDTVVAEEIVLSKTSLSIGADETYRIDAGVYPNNVKNKTITWKSSDNLVATVDNNGNVKGISTGTAVITATSADGKASAECGVTVSGSSSGGSAGDSTALKDAKYIEFFDARSTMYVNSSQTMKIRTDKGKIVPNGDLKWSVSDKSMATVDSQGVVKVKRNAGTVTVSADTRDGKLFDSYRITVTREKVDVTDISLTDDKVVVTVGSKSNPVKVKITPSNAAVADLSWSTANSKIATVDSSGVVTGKQKGSTTLIVKTKDGKYTVTCRIEVVEVASGLIESFEIYPDTFELRVGSEDYLDVDIYPSNISGIAINWRSSRPSIVSVDSKGNIKALAKGTATITATLDSDSSIKSSCVITVVE